MPHATSSVAGDLQIAASGSGFISYTLSSFSFFLLAILCFNLNFFLFLLPLVFFISFGIVVEDLWNLRNGDASH